MTDSEHAHNWYGGLVNPDAPEIADSISWQKTGAGWGSAEWIALFDAAAEPIDEDDEGNIIDPPDDTESGLIGIYKID